MPQDHNKPSYQNDFLHLALAASCYSADACAHASCIQKHATLVCICGSYLWPASLPKEPMVRRGLEGLTQLGSGVFCTSVLTSGSISEGEGVSFAPAMALCLPECYLQQRAANMFPPPGVGADRLTQRKPAFPVSLVPLTGGGGASASLAHHGVLRHTEASISLSPGYRALLHP